MKIDVLQSTGCAKCLREISDLRAAARKVDPGVEWRELDILQAIDYAVELGVLKPPAVAIDGELVFPSLPSPEALAAAMRSRSGA
jgi:thioredoxin 1